MSPTRVVGIAVAGLILGAGIGLGYSLVERFDQPEPTTSLALPDSKVVHVIPDFSYTDLKGHERNSNEWKSKILVLNFWASWCPPCRQETPGFVKLQNKFRKDNVEFVGIAVDDPAPVRRFVKAFGVDYPVLLGDMSAIKLSSRLGNRFEGLPFTVVAEPGGKIILRHTGALSEHHLEQLLKKTVNASQSGELSGFTG